MPASAAKAAPNGAAVPSPQPDRYRLHGRALSVVYYPHGVGPIGQDGRLRLSYRDASMTVGFYGDAVRTAEVPDLGTIVSVTLASSVDVGSTTFSVLIPDVAMGAPNATAHVGTFAVTTMHHAVAGAPQRAIYTITPLVGTADSGVIPDLCGKTRL